MKITELRKRGALVSPGLVEKGVSWTHPDPETGEEVTDEFTVFVRVLSYGQVEQVIQSLPEDPERSYNASLISKAVVLGDGTIKGSESFTYEDAYQLDPSLAYAFISAVNEVNQRGGAQKKLTAADEIWHELVLNGIGGRTIREAKERMTWQEALDWSEYIRRYGSLNTARNLESGFALIASIISRATGGKARMVDFMPHAPSEDEQEISLDEAFERWQ